MNRVLVGVVALAAALQGTAATAIEKDGSVLVLTDANFDDAIKVSTREKGGGEGREQNNEEGMHRWPRRRGHVCVQTKCVWTCSTQAQ